MDSNSVANGGFGPQPSQQEPGIRNGEVQHG